VNVCGSSSYMEKYEESGLILGVCESQGFTSGNTFLIEKIRQ
jgi:hypothetical protein